MYALSRYWVEVRVKPEVPAVLSSGKQLPVPTKQEGDWAHNQSGHFGEDKCLLKGIHHGDVKHNQVLFKYDYIVQSKKTLIRPKLQTLLKWRGGWDSVVGIAARYRLDGPGIEF